MSYTGEIKVTRPSAVHNLGAAAAIVDALVVGTAVASALAVAAAVYAAGKLIGAPAKIIGGAVKNVKAGKIKKELASAAESVEKLGGEFSESLDEASAACCAKYEEAVKRLEKIYEREHDLSAFRADLAEAEKSLRREISEKSRALESSYIGALNDTMSGLKNELEIDRREIIGSMQRMSGDIAKKEKAASIAEETIVRTEELLGELNRQYEGSELCAKAFSECLQLCAAARDHLSSGLYEAALSDAYAAETMTLTKIADIAAREMENRQRLIDVKAMLDGCGKLIGSMASVEFVFDKTLDGIPLNAQVSDFRTYYRGKYEELEDYLGSFKKRFERREPTDFAPEELEDILAGLTRWKEEFLDETTTAYERLDDAMLRCETVQLLREKYENDGYEELAPEESDSEVSPLDCIFLRMRHRDTGERLCFRLYPEIQADGHIGMSIEIEDHTRYGGGAAEIENARERARESVCSAIKNSGAGKNMQLRQRCLNPGVRDEE